MLLCASELLVYSSLVFVNVQIPTYTVYLRKDVEVVGYSRLNQASSHHTIGSATFLRHFNAIRLALEYQEMTRLENLGD